MGPGAYEFLVGVGWVRLCQSMQFLIFVNIHSKSLICWEVSSLPGNLVSGVLQGGLWPQSLCRSPSLPLPLPAPSSSVHLQSIVLRPPSCLLASPVWLFHHVT